MSSVVESPIVPFGPLAARAPTLWFHSPSCQPPVRSPTRSECQRPVYVRPRLFMSCQVSNGYRVGGRFVRRSGRPPSCRAPSSPVVTSSPTLFRCRPDNLHTIMPSSAFRTKSPSRSVILCTVREYVSHTTSSRILDIDQAPQYFGPPSHHVWTSVQVLSNTYRFGPWLNPCGNPTFLLPLGPTCPITIRAHCLEQPTVSPGSFFL